MDATIEVRRKRLRFQSWHRGSRELDLVLGPFADAHLGRMTPDQLDRYDALLAHPDDELFDWISGRSPLPAALDSDVMCLIKHFNGLFQHTDT